MPRTVEQPPPRRRSAPAPRRPKGGGGGWVVLALLIAAAGAGVFFYGDQLRSLIGIAHRPSTEGREPTAPDRVDAHLVAKTPPESAPESSGVQVARAAPETQPLPQPAPTGPIVPNADETRARTLLAKAETAYRGYAWDAAESLAQQILDLQGVEPKTAARARAIQHGAPELRNLFAKLDSRDELSRNYDTNPSLVRIDIGEAQPLYAVPVSNDDAKHPEVVTSDPVGYVRAAMRAGPVNAMILGSRQFIFGNIPGTINRIELVDQRAVHQRKAQEFEEKLAALRNSAAAQDALAWYAAAKFAYQNRLDEQVTSMLDQALALDPLLVRSVREEAAGKMLSAMTLQLNMHNRAAATSWMASIRAHYADTDQGKQAIELYNGDIKAMLVAARQEEEHRKQEEEERKQALIARAKEDGDTQRVAQIEAQKAPEPEDTTPAAPIADLSSAESEAQAAMDAGMPIYKAAMEMPATPERNVQYKKAEAYFAKAKALYAALLEKHPGDEDLEAKMVEAGKLRFGCSKDQTVW